MRWDLEEGLREDRSKCWRREDAAVVVVVVEGEIEETAAARLRASSISSLSSSLTSIVLAFLLSIFPKIVLGCSSTTFYTNLFSGIWAAVFGPIWRNGEN